jgi:hypothetical protein
MYNWKSDGDGRKLPDIILALLSFRFSGLKLSSPCCCFCARSAFFILVVRVRLSIWFVNINLYNFWKGRAGRFANKTILATYFSLGYGTKTFQYVPECLTISHLKWCLGRSRSSANAWVTVQYSPERSRWFNNRGSVLISIWLGAFLQNTLQFGWRYFDMTWQADCHSERLSLWQLIKTLVVCSLLSWMCSAQSHSRTYDSDIRICKCDRA